MTQDELDTLVGKHLGWRKVIRNPNFVRAWCEPGCPFPVNNRAAVAALRAKGVVAEIPADE